MYEINTPKISVIVPVYNVEKYIHQCIDSILGQTFTDFELLLIDDGSPDNCGAICDEYAAKDSRVRVFHQENAGVSAARNKGLDEAKGEWISFVDSDDWIVPDYLLYVIKASENFKIIFFGYTNFSDTHILSNSVNCGAIDSIISQSDIIAKLVDNDLFGYVCTKLFRKDIISTNKLVFKNNIPICEDLLFTMDYISVLPESSIGFVPMSLYNYRINNDSATNKYRKDFFHVQEMVNVEYIDKIKYLVSDVSICRRLIFIRLFKSINDSLINIYRGNLSWQECYSEFAFIWSSYTFCCFRQVNSYLLAKKYGACMKLLSLLIFLRCDLGVFSLYWLRSKIK